MVFLPALLIFACLSSYFTPFSFGVGKVIGNNFAFSYFNSKLGMELLLAIFTLFVGGLSDIAVAIVLGLF